jgi:hypothetical protein
MAHQLGRTLLSLMGFVIYGDLGPLTMYKSKRGKIVFFTKTWPDRPPSYYQLLDRARFSVAAFNWNNLPAADKAQWNLAARRASLCCTGYNLYVYCWTAPDTSTLVTLARQTRTTLACACHAPYP